MASPESFEHQFNIELSPRALFFAAVAQRMYEAKNATDQNPSQRFLAQGRDRETGKKVVYFGIFAKIDNHAQHMELGIPVDSADLELPQIEIDAEFILHRTYSEGEISEQKILVGDQEAASDEVAAIKAVLDAGTVVPIRPIANV